MLFAAIDLVEQLLFLLVFQLAADEMPHRHFAAVLVLRILDVGRESGCAERRMFLPAVPAAFLAFALSFELDDVEAEVGLDKCRSNLSRLKSQSRIFERLDHAALGHILVDAALAFAVRVLVAGIFLNSLASAAKSSPAFARSRISSAFVRFCRDC